jgi:hypothetical protein
MLVQQKILNLSTPTSILNLIQLGFVVTVLMLLTTINILNAQVKNNGIITIGDKGVFHITSGIFNFGLGNITTSRSHSDHGSLSFSSEALWEKATSINHVDGYVESSFDFIYPTGQAGIYAPIQVTSSNSEKIKAAYTRANPSQNRNTYNSSVAIISKLEFWNIDGVNSANTISLTWRNSSTISNFTNAELSELTIVGWNGKSWLAIPSKADSNSILGEISSLESGSITSIPEFNLADFSIFTFGKKEVQADPIQFSIYVWHNTLYVDSSQPIDSLIVYTLWGQKLIEKKIAPTEHYYTPFFHSQAVYVAIVSFENKSQPELTTKIMNNL